MVGGYKRGKKIHSEREATVLKKTVSGLYQELRKNSRGKNKEKKPAAEYQ